MSITFVVSFAVVLLLASIAIITGWALARLTRSALIPRLTPESSVAAAGVGFAFWTTGSVWLSLAGLTVPRAGAVLAAGAAVMVVLAWRRRSARIFATGFRSHTALGLAVVVVGVAIVSLLSLLRNDAFSIGNDTFHYCALSGWFQRHAFSKMAVRDPASPLDAYPLPWQQLDTPTAPREAATPGAAFVLALVQAGLGLPSALRAYPATSTFAMMLSAAAVFLLARWALGRSRPVALFSAALFAALPHPLYWAHHHGFLQQTIAMPLFLIAVALLGRLVRLRARTPGDGFLVGLVMATLLIVYLPIIPFIFAPWGMAFLMLFLRATKPRPRRAALAFMAVTAATFLALAWRDVFHGLWRLFALSRMVAGWHVAYHPLEFLAGAVGWTPGQPTIPGPGLGAGVIVLAIALATLALVGLHDVVRRWRLATTFLAMFASLIVIVAIHVVIADPWTGKAGHTWGLFRLLQWTLPATLMLEVVGLTRLASSRKSVSTAVIALLVGVGLVEHWQSAAGLGKRMRRMFQSDAPLADVTALERRLQSLPDGRLVLLGHPSDLDVWLGAYAALFVYPREIVGDWEGDAAIAGSPEAAGLYRDALARLGSPGLVPIVVGAEASSAVEPLGAGFGLLTQRDRAAVLYVSGEAASHRAKVLVLAPVAGALEMRLIFEKAVVAEGIEAFRFAGDRTRNIRRASEAPAPVKVDGRAGAEWRLCVPAVQGLNTIVVDWNKPAEPAGSTETRALTSARIAGDCSL